MSPRGVFGSERELEEAEAWAGEGVRLTPAQNAEADRFLAGARAAEPAISEDMQRISTEVGTELRGYDFRLKSDESFKRKFGEQLQDGDLEAALDSSKDAVRYTFCSDADSYASATTDVCGKLQDAGYQGMGWKNSWGDEGYQGINSFWETPDGSGKVEVQFHTPESFDAKMRTHELYEQARRPETAPEDVARLQVEQNEVFAPVPQPGGAQTLSGAAADSGSGASLPEPAGAGASVAPGSDAGDQDPVPEPEPGHADAASSAPLSDATPDPERSADAEVRNDDPNESEMSADAGPSPRSEATERPEAADAMHVQSRDANLEPKSAPDQSPTTNVMQFDEADHVPDPAPGTDAETLPSHDAAEAGGSRAGLSEAVPDPTAESGPDETPAPSPGGGSETSASEPSPSETPAPQTSASEKPIQPLPEDAEAHL